MALFKINVTNSVSDKPYTVDSVNDNCQTLLSVFVPVASGQTRSIEIVSNNAYGSLSQTYTINTSQIVTVTIDGEISTTPSLNNIFSSSYIRVSLTSSSSPYYSKGITRQHAINVC